MAHLVTAPITLSFATDRRYSWWARLIRSLARLGRAVAGERPRRRAVRGPRGRDRRLPGFPALADGLR
jgi:hypothetical protein